MNSTGLRMILRPIWLRLETPWQKIPFVALPIGIHPTVQKASWSTWSSSFTNCPMKRTVYLLQWILTSIFQLVIVLNKMNF